MRKIEDFLVLLLTFLNLRLIPEDGFNVWSAANVLTSQTLPTVCLQTYLHILVWWYFITQFSKRRQLEMLTVFHVVPNRPFFMLECSITACDYFADF